MKTPLPADQARLYFLLTICTDRPGVGPHVARSYLAEKVMMLWRCQTPWEMRSRLDLERQREFDKLVANDGYAPVKAG